MTTKLSRNAYERLIEEDLTWLRSLPHTLERAHVIDIVMRSADHEYSDSAPLCDLALAAQKYKEVKRVAHDAWDRYADNNNAGRAHILESCRRADALVAQARRDIHVILERMLDG